MRRFYLIVLFLFIFSFLTNENIGKDVYYGNTWGNRYLTKSNVEIYLDETSEMTIYSINSNKVLYCYDRIEKEKIFCWYIFNREENPLSGWVIKEKIMRIK